MNKFKVEFVVDASKLGEVLTKVHGLVADLDIGVVESVPHTQNRKRSKKPHGTGRELIRQALMKAEGNTLTMKAAKDLLTQAGFVGDSIYNAKYALMKEGFIEFKNGVMRMIKK